MNCDRIEVSKEQVETMQRIFDKEFPTFGNIEIEGTNLNGIIRISYRVDSTSTYMMDILVNQNGQIWEM